MLDVFGVADLLVSHALKHHGEEIDIIGYYGSYAKGTASVRSDLDIFYIPAEGTDPPVARAFLVEGVLFDFWRIKWETMAGFATGRIRGWSLAPGIVYHAKLLHARSDECTARFAGLRQQIIELQKPGARPQMIQRSLDVFSHVLTHLGNLHIAAAGTDFADVRHAGWNVVLSVWECLTLANQAFIDSGSSSIVEHASLLESKPPCFEQLVTAITTSPDSAEVVSAADRLATETRRILRQFQETLPSHHAARDVFGQAYPEINAQVGKVLSVCEREDEVGASAAAWLMQCDLSFMLAELRDGAGAHRDFNLYSESAEMYREIGLPDLMTLTPGDLPALKEQAVSLDERLRQWLQGQAVDLCEFATLEEFERSLLR